MPVIICTYAAFTSEHEQESPPIRGVAGLNEDINPRIPWSYIRKILRKIKDVDVALFYMTAYTENGNHPAPAGHPSTGGELNPPTPNEAHHAKKTAYRDSDVSEDT